MGDLPGGVFFSRFYSVSADGTTVVGESQSANGPEAVRWRADTGLVSLGELPGGAVSGGAVATSADGGVIAGSSLTRGDRIEEEAAVTLIAAATNLLTLLE